MSLQCKIVGFILVAVTAILGIKEVTRHYVAKSQQIKLTLPYCLPLPITLGCFGTLTSIKSHIPDRRALWNIAIIPSAVSLVMSTVLLSWGLLHSSITALPFPTASLHLASSLNVGYNTAFAPQTSIFVAIIAQILTKGQFAQSAIDMHPLAAAGWAGLAISAFSLMPVGRLEGGQIIHAILGRPKSIIIGQITRLLLLALALLSQPWLRVFVLGLFLLEQRTQSALNEATELETFRDVLGLALLTVGLLIIMPVPKFLLPLLILK